MEVHLASLDKRQMTLLLTAVTFGGQDASKAFEHLPDDERGLLTERAAALLEIPRDKRLPLLVQELKKLMAPRPGLLSSADPEKLAELLRKERPALRQLLLGALPHSLADSVRTLLPREPRAVFREVRPEVLALVRGGLEDVLARTPPTRGGFKFADVLVLQSRELLTLSDAVGARGLGSALAGLPPDERERFLLALPAHQRQLASHAAERSAHRGLKPEDARELLAMHGGVESPAVCLRSAGLQRLARACLAQSAEFAQRVVARHPGEFGAQLSRWIRDERSKAIHRGDGGRAEIVEDMHQLAQRGLVERPHRLAPPPKLLDDRGSQKPGLPHPSALRMASLGLAGPRPAFPASPKPAPSETSRKTEGSREKEPSRNALLAPRLPAGRGRGPRGSG